MAVIFEACCPRCGSANVHRSGTKTIATRLARLALMRAYRCHECMKLHFGPFWIKALPTGRRQRESA
jgi:phage FluMu protein Com